MDMKRGLWLVLAGIGINSGLAAVGVAQSSAPVPVASPGGAQTNSVAPAGTGMASSSKRPVRKKPDGAMQTIPIESAPPSPPSPTETEAQKAADQKLLQQQQAQSAQAAKVTDEQVHAAQQRIDRIQSEQRIQDAPGLSQTGLVPAGGPPVQPANTAPAQTVQPAVPPSTPPQD